MSIAYRYKLGLDVGVASIGTALVKLDAEGNPTGILDLGTRIFDTPAGAAERRSKRQMRKTIRRRSQRLKYLAALLREHGILSENKEDIRGLLCFSPYALRAHGARTSYDHLHELGRALLHMAKFRGASFLTQLEESGDSDEEKGKAQKDRQKSAESYRLLEGRLKKSGQTLSEYFHERLNGDDKQPVRRRKRFVEDNRVDFAVPRFLVKEDFHWIWDKQAEFFPQLFPELKEKVSQAIFVDKPHAPYAVALCSLAPDSGERRLPKLHRLSEQRRIYEQINNIRLITASGSHTLNRECRDLLAVEVFSGESLNKTRIKALLGPKLTEKIFSINLGEDDKAIKPCAHAVAFKEVPSWQMMNQDEQDALLDFIAEPRIDPNNVDSPLMPEDDYVQSVAVRLKLDGPNAAREASRILNVLPKDRASLGLSATRKILEKLIEGRWIETPAEAPRWEPHTNRTAADACGYRAEEEKHRAMMGAFDTLPYYGQVLHHDVSPVHPWHLKSAAPEEAESGRVPNPVVHVALNQVRKVLNEIIVLYGKPQSIHVELAREFGKSAARREEIAEQNVARKKDNDRIDSALRELNMTCNRRNRDKYRLWKEQKGRDIYTYEEIGATELQSCEIDHIIPRSVGGSNTYMNLALTKVNLGKGTRFAHEFIQSGNPDKWPHILGLISKRGEYPPAKAWRFMPEAEEKYRAFGDEEHTDNRMTDTSYIAKMSKRYLSLLCPEVVCLRGGITAELRHQWGLDGLEYELAGLNTPRELVDPLTGEVRRNPEWQAKPRLDHRHHALDALVAACVTRSMVQYVSRQERLGKRLSELRAPFGQNAAEFRAMTLNALQAVRVSPKAEHAKTGQLHDETKYRYLKEQPNSSGLHLIKYRHELNRLDSKDKVAKMLPTASTIPVDDHTVRTVLEKLKAQKEAIESRYARAEQALKERYDEAERQSKKPAKITEKHVVQEAVRLAGREEKDLGSYYTILDHKRLVNLRPELQCGNEPNNNFCMDFYERTDGKVGWECITRFEVNQPDFEPVWKKNNHKLLWRVWNGDVLEVTLTSQLREKYRIPTTADKTFMRVQKMCQGGMVCNMLTDARELSPKEGSARWVSSETGLIFFTMAQARKVELTPFGKIARKHKKLWHGKKTRKD